MTASLTDSVVYTAIFDDYDVLTDPNEPSNGIDYICFTDNPEISSEVWEIECVQTEGLAANESNRRLKILPHQNRKLSEYEYSVYIDGNIHLTRDISGLIEECWDSDFACPQHYRRSCVFDEGEVCIQRSKGVAEEIRTQLDRYRDEGFPENYGLSANSVIFRRHSNEQVQELSEDWWEEYKRGSSRDQLSLPYVAWKNDYTYNLIGEGPRLGSEYFLITSHLGDKRPKSLWRYWIKCQAKRGQASRYTAGFYLGSSIRKLKRGEVLEVVEGGFKLAFTPLYERILETADNYGIVGPDKIYGDRYYEKRRHDPYRSEAHEIARALNEEFNPDSVIDFGCAIGAYLEFFYNTGKDIQGVEGNEAALNYAVVPTKYIDHYDLREYYDSDKHFDMVLSIEVAEHLPQRVADTFADTLSSAGDTVVMSAARPGQGGTHHINEQPRQYWKNKFRERGFEYKGKLVKRVREQIEVEKFSHVPANLFVFEADRNGEFDVGFNEERDLV